jgi:DNA-binding transcriptional LysR family regulator
MELRDIEYFTVVAEHGHLGRAAESLGLSQPALSKSLRRLERLLDAKLVKRTPKGVELTTEGSALLIRTRELRLSLQSVKREISDLSEGKIGYVRVGAGALIVEQLFPACLMPLLQNSPKTRFKIIVSDNDLMIPALRTGELDLLINYPPRTMSREGLIEEPLFDDEFVVVASAKHRLAKLKRVTLSDLSAERWVLSEPTLLAQQRLHRAFLERGLPTPEVLVETRSTNLKRATVASSSLLDFSSKLALENGPHCDRLRILAVKELTWRRPVSLIYREAAYLSPATRSFIASVKDIAATWQTGV